MPDLSPEQRTFLAAHAIPLSLVFDASGMTRGRYQELMAQQGKQFAFGTGICNRLHRSIRSRTGHCMQCNPARIAFVLGEDAPANVYIAGSKLARLLKVGRSSDLNSRLRNLNVERWANRGDWLLLAFAHTKRAGRVERLVHGRLSSWGASCDYVQGGIWHHSHEVFRCDFADAKDALEAALSADVEIVLPNAPETSEAYNFRQTVPEA